MYDDGSRTPMACFRLVPGVRRRQRGKVLSLEPNRPFVIPPG